MRTTHLLLVILAMVVLLPVIPVSAQASLEILQTDFTVEVHEAFTIQARLTNPDLLNYNSFHLYSTGPEDHNWGWHTFNGESYSLYTDSWTTSLSETGYHSLFIECSGGSVPTLVDQVTVYVTSESSSTSVSPILVIIPVLAVAVGLYVVLRKRHPSSPPQSPQAPQSPQPDYHTRVLVICPFCGAKTEQGITHCQHCKAPL